MNPKNNFTCVGTWAIIYGEVQVIKAIVEVLEDKKGFYVEIGQTLRAESGCFPNLTAWCLIDKTGYKK